MTSPNPNGIPSSSPGLRGTSYPGFTVKRNPNPNGVVSSRAESQMAATPLGLMKTLIRVPRVARASQPWAGGHSPVGAKERDLLFHDTVAQTILSGAFPSDPQTGLSALLSLNAPSHPIRNRLLRLTAASPDLLAVIKQEGKV